MVNSRAITIRETAWIDYLLTAVLGTLAIYAIGQGISQPAVGWICGTVYCLGTGVSFLIGTRVRGTPTAALDGLIYASAAFIAVAGQSYLNELLPVDSFPIELRSAGWVTWLLSLGSFAAWRDATRLFQAVPALALFGLVGVYDTYPAATFLFFGYLLCLALMFGRAHARSMLLQATQSGFARIEEGVSLSESGLDRDSVLRAMRRGPWRWMAGPEWAVASAGAVILVSLFGAPIVHASFQSVASSIHLSVSMPNRMMQAKSQSSTVTTESLATIGTGPRHLLNTRIGLAQLDRARYLRAAIFETYSPKGWSSDRSQAQPTSESGVRAAFLRRIEEPRRFQFKTQLDNSPSAGSVPIPSEVESISDPPDAEIQLDGTVRVRDRVVAGTALESKIALNSSTPRENQTSRRPSRSEALPIASLQNFTDEVTRGCKTDLEKANKLMDAIASQAKYNLDAPAVPKGQDAVEYFLFSSKEGYCDLFASAMVVLARDAGISAQYVTGYVTDESDRDNDGAYILRQSDSHAWAELYFNGIGWVIFDPTTMAKDVTPSGEHGGINAVWIPGALGLAALAALVYYGPRLRLRVGLSKSVVRQRRLEGLYVKFARELGRRARLRKPASATPDGWLSMTRQGLGRALPAAATLNEQFVESLYAEGAVSEERLDQLSRSLKRFRRTRG